MNNPLIIVNIIINDHFISLLELILMIAEGIGKLLPIEQHQRINILVVQRDEGASCFGTHQGHITGNED